MLIWHVGKLGCSPVREGGGKGNFPRGYHRKKEKLVPMMVDIIHSLVIAVYRLWKMLTTSNDI